MHLAVYVAIGVGVWTALGVVVRRYLPTGTVPDWSHERADQAAADTARLVGARGEYGRLMTPVRLEAGRWVVAGTTREEEARASAEVNAAIKREREQRLQEMSAPAPQEEAGHVTPFGRRRRAS